MIPISHTDYNTALTLIAKGVARAHETRAALLATPILDYAATLAVTPERLAEMWDMSLTTLYDLCLNRLPQDEAWSDYVGRLASGLGYDADKLHDILWRVLE